MSFGFLLSLNIGPESLQGSGIKSKAPVFCVISGKNSVAEVGELEGLPQLGATYQRHHLLQIIALLAGDTHFVALNGRLHLDLGILDQFDQLLGHVALDSLLELHFLKITTA